MTTDQIAYLLGLYPPGEGAGPTEFLKGVGLSSGRFFSVNSAAGTASAYALDIDLTNGYLYFSPLVPASGASEIVPATEVFSVESVETMAFFI
jgi:hypothetical protein